MKEDQYHFNSFVESDESVERIHCSLVDQTSMYYMFLIFLFEVMVGFLGALLTSGPDPKPKLGQRRTFLRLHVKKGLLNVKNSVNAGFPVDALLSLYPGFLMTRMTIELKVRGYMRKQQRLIVSLLHRKRKMLVFNYERVADRRKAYQMQNQKA